MFEISQCGSSEPFALRVIGDDMAPEFVDGNIVIVDPGGLVADGCFVVVNIGDEFSLRQLKKTGCDYQAVTLNSADSDLISLENIVGVVSQKAGRRRHQRKRYDV